LYLEEKEEEEDMRKRKKSDSITTLIKSSFVLCRRAAVHVRIIPAFVKKIHNATITCKLAAHFLCGLQMK
jgi:hypothetical protein